MVLSWVKLIHYFQLNFYKIHFNIILMCIPPYPLRMQYTSNILFVSSLMLPMPI